MEEAVKKCEGIIQWFEGRPLPECPFMMNECTTVLDARKFVDWNVDAMKRLFENTKCGLGFTLLRTTYLRLYTLKKYIENEQSKAT